MPSSPGMRSVSPDLAFSMWRRGLHAKGGIHKPESHPDRSQQGCAIPRRQGRQRCPQSTDSEGGSPEDDCTTKEIRGAEVNFLSMPFGVYSSGIPPLRRPARKIASNRVWLT